MAARAELTQPLLAEFANEVEHVTMVGCRACQEGKDDPEEKGVDGEKGTVVEEDAYKFSAVANADNIGMSQ